MNLADFMETHFKDEADDPSPDVKAESQGTVMGPTGGICWPHSNAATCDVAADNDDEDDLDYSYEIDADDLNIMKANYDLLDDIITWVLCDDVDLPPEIAKRLQMGAGDIHFLINQFEKYKPQDAGYPDILSTIEDRAKDVNLRAAESVK
jgi:hypothetical protein